MLACSRVGNPTKLFIFAQDGKTKTYRVCHSTSINNYLQDTQQNIYFSEWRGNARRALASNLCFVFLRKSRIKAKNELKNFSCAQFWKLRNEICGVREFRYDTIRDSSTQWDKGFMSYKEFHYNIYIDNTLIWCNYETFETQRLISRSLAYLEWRNNCFWWAKFIGSIPL